MTCGANTTALLSAGAMTFRDLTDHVHEQLVGRFDGSISWYVTAVKLDLEANRVIERVPGKKPQALRLGGR